MQQAAAGMEKKKKSWIMILYVFFPAMQVFMTRNVVCLSYVLIAIVIFTLFSNSQDSYGAGEHYT